MKKDLGPQCILYPTPVLIVGTYDADGKANVMNAAWGGICCSTPPCVTVSLQKPRHSYQAILDRKCYTVNIPSERHIAEADYFGISSGRTVDKFAKTGLTAVKADTVDAPYVAEFPVVLECRLAHTLEAGSHTLFVGEVLDVKVDEGCLNADGSVDVTKVKPCMFTPGSRGYYGLGEFLGQAFSIGKTFA